MSANNSEFHTAIDLCAGCGAASFGMQNTGFNIRAAFEIDPAALYTYKVHIADHDDMALLSHDVTDVATEKIHDDIDFVFAGPPCQPFSEARGEHAVDDPKRTVPYSVVEWIDALKPKAAAIENVGGLKRNHQDVLSVVLDDLRDSGYQVSIVELDAADYRVPQKRSRIFILAVRHDQPLPSQWKPPKVRSDDPQQRRFDSAGQTTSRDGYRTAGEALEELPPALPPQPPKDDPVHMVSHYNDRKVTPHACGEFMEINGKEVKMPPNHVAADHGDTHRKRMAEFPLGHSGASTTKRRLDPDEPAPTMTVSQGTPPVHYQGKAPSNDEPLEKVRRLTVRECARLQTFPDHWCFAGSKHEQFRQVGNAVPPLLASHVADHLRRTVLEKGVDEQKRPIPA